MGLCKGEAIQQEVSSSLGWSSSSNGAIIADNLAHEGAQWPIQIGAYGLPTTICRLKKKGVERRDVSHG